MFHPLPHSARYHSYKSAMRKRNYRAGMTVLIVGRLAGALPRNATQVFMTVASRNAPKAKAWFVAQLLTFRPIALVEKERTCRLQGRAFDCPDKSGSACKFRFLGAMVAGPVQASAVVDP
jgi:hypothetical protein